MSRTERRPRTGLRLAVGGDGPPRWFVLTNWTNRERQASRVECRNAAKEHRGSGVVDTIPTIRQHHHGVQWLWW